MASSNGSLEQAAIPAPYLPFKTFLGAIETLEQGLPRKIDRTIWRSQSGLNQGLIMGAFRFFGLLNEDDHPTPALQRLVENKDKRPLELKSLIEKHYSTLVAHDLTRMTPKLLEDAMEGYNVSGTTKRKAVTFLLQAAKYADMPLSSFLQSQVRTTGPRKRRSSRRAENGTADESIKDNVGSAGTSDNTRTIQLKSNGSITLQISADVFSLSAEDRKYVFELIDKLQEYEKETASDNA